MEMTFGLSFVRRLSFIGGFTGHDFYPILSTRYCQERAVGAFFTCSLNPNLFCHHFSRSSNTLAIIARVLLEQEGNKKETPQC